MRIFINPINGIITTEQVAYNVRYVLAICRKVLSRFRHYFQRDKKTNEQNDAPETSE